jgi:hypothetical protein
MLVANRYVSRPTTFASYSVTRQAETLIDERRRVDEESWERAPPT